LKSDKVVIDADVEINGDIKLNGSQHTTGTTLVEEQLTGQGGMAISGGSGASITGSMIITSGDVTADGVGLKSHKHSNPEGGMVGPATG
jgi:phage gp45-like